MTIHCSRLLEVKKGGVGKTTTTVNIAAGLIKEGKRVLTIDQRSWQRVTYKKSGDIRVTSAGKVDIM